MKELKGFYIAFFMIVCLISFIMCTGKSTSTDSKKDNKKDYTVIIKYSGGVITDIYKLNHSDDCSCTDISIGDNHIRFKDINLNPIYISGESKAISCDVYEYNKYVEYHIEFDNMTYQDKLKIK